MLGLGGVGVLWGSKVQDLLERALAGVTVKDGTGLSSLLPIGRFRIYSVTGDLPSRRDAAYRLTINGHVERPTALSLTELRSMPATNLVKDFQCVTGWRVHHVRWTGVRLADVLDRAGVKADAGGVAFTSFDGTYTESLTVPQARRADVIVAYEMEGRHLSSEHGGPVRLYVAPMYGYKSCKWLDTITVTKGLAPPGYWEQQGYDVDAFVGKSNGRDDHPTS